MSRVEGSASAAAYGAGAPDLRLPIVEHIPVRLGPAERDHIAGLARRLRRDDPRMATTEAFGPRVRVGIGPTPSLHVHDSAAVQLAGRRHPSALEYRAFALAGEGDAIALSMPRVPAFETYCRDVLGLGSVEVLHALSPDPRASLATRSRQDPAVFSRLADLASASGGLTIHPYIGSGAVWALAGAIAERAGVTIRVAAPPPRLTRCVNDKLWFARRISELLGERSLPPGTEAYSLAILAGRVRALARKHDRIGLKLPSAAGGEGNVVLDAAPLRDLSLSTLRDFLKSLLLRLRWKEPFPVLVTVWESPVAMSPSVQIWIPELSSGPPLVEAIFEQQVSGITGEFVGAIPAVLPRPWQDRIAREAVLLGTLFQDLGYFGRCSLDAILVGRDLGEAELHWVECNGRWGGASIPMTLVNRLTGDWAESPFVVLHPDPRPELRFADALRRTRERLYQTGKRSGIVYFSPGSIESGHGMELLVIGRTIVEARRGAEEVARLLQGRGPAHG